jgi:hypothetical protein
MRPLPIAILASFVVLVASFWNRNEIPAGIDYVDAVYEEPRQTPTREAAFDAVYNDRTYRVEPQYEYDITGMVVSYRHHEGDSRMHRLSDDHLNMLDVCVIWGENTANPRLDQITFWNGIFTCNVETRDEAAWQAFDMYKLSNNHLISDQEHIRDAVRAIRIGDQIRVRGYLASYTNPVGSTRGTSTTRLDTGNGACETIYVEAFEIVEAATSGWRLAMWTSLATLAMSLVVYFRRPYRPYPASA